jgi:hypothetical protein
MALLLPEGIPIAALGKGALSGLGTLMQVGNRDVGRIVALKPDDPTDVTSIWVDPAYTAYRSAWNASALIGLVYSLDEWKGPKPDVDHLYPRSWARLPGSEVSWVRLFPVWAEVNRSAGQREKRLLSGFRTKPILLGQIVFADELQILKIIGFPFEGAAGTPRVFARARRSSG